MKALITGASGFVATELAAQLSRAGHQCIGLSRSSRPPARPEHFAQVLAFEPDRLAEQLAEQLATLQPDLVFHTATRFVAEHQAQDVQPVLEANVLFGCQLLEAMRQAGLRRLVNCSSHWVHFEGAAPRPSNFYALSKQMFENALDYYGDAFGIGSTTLILGDSYGPADPRGKLVSALIDAAHSGRELALSPGQQRLSLTHVRDVAAALQVAGERQLQASEPLREQFTVSGELIRLVDLIEAVQAVTGRPLHAKLGARPYRFREVMQPSLHAAPPLPGWQASIPLRDGLRELAAPTQAPAP
ncbi:MAG: NAD(P)-dependent oxidoreductase [Inhella sp.]